MLQGERGQSREHGEQGPMEEVPFSHPGRDSRWCTQSQSLHRSIHLVSRRLGTGHEYLVDLCSYWEPKVERGLCPRLTPGLHLLC